MLLCMLECNYVHISLFKKLFFTLYREMVRNRSKFQDIILVVQFFGIGKSFVTIIVT